MKQPKILPFFFLTEMWERFGFYTVEALLVLYMTYALQFSDDHAYTILGEFTALVYIMPLVGGYLADKWIGYRFAILLGGILLCAGYACLTIFSYSIFTGMTLIILGNGLLKPNISTFLGQFYTDNDARREGGFTLFYVGINLGVLGATGFSGFIREWYGWEACFGVACAGMILGTLIFRASFSYLEGKGFSPKKPDIQSFSRYLLSSSGVLALLLVIGALIYTLFQYPGVTEELLTYVGVLMVVSFLGLAFKLKGQERKRMLALILLVLSSVVYWGLFSEMFFAVNLFTDRVVSHRVWHFDVEVPTVAFIALEAAFIIILGPVLAKWWQSKIGQTRFMTTPYKFAYALLIMGLGLQLLVLATHHADTGLILPRWMLAFYLLVAFSELLLSPIGLAMISELSPKRYSGMMMGVWFLALAYGGAISGFLARSASIPDNIQTAQEMLPIYAGAFQSFANMAYVCFIVLFILGGYLHRLMTSK